MSRHVESFDSLLEKVNSTPEGRAIGAENTLRRRLAAIIEAQPDARERLLAVGLKRKHVRRLLHEEQGGVLPLRALCLAADALGLRLTVTLEPTP